MGLAGDGGAEGGESAECGFFVSDACCCRALAFAVGLWEGDVADGECLE